MRARFASSCASTVALACAACGGIVGNGSGAPDAGAGSRDASPFADVTVQESSAPDATDATAVDAGCPVPGQVRTAPGGACACPPATYSALDDVSNWETFDVSSTVPIGFIGGAFDTRYVYAAFASPGSWAELGVLGHPGTVSSAAVEHAAFDGRYVYFPPYYGGVNDYRGSVVRYDPQGAFTSRTSWTTFDLSTVNPSAAGFQGAVFDGRYLYLVPSENGAGTFDGVVARYDTTAPFDDSASWATFDVATANAAAKGFRGGAFDGRYLYLVPGPGLWIENTTNPNTFVARYDTTAEFGSAASWSTFDLATVNPGDTGLVGGAFAGAAFDGRYLYLVPFVNGVAAYSVVMRFDSTAAFGDPTSWSTFDVSTLNAGAKGFQGAVFDGRYVYLAPSIDHYAVPCAQCIFGVIARYDTMAPFASSSSWTAFDLTILNPGAKGFSGAVFDGRYVYLMPYVNGLDASTNGVDGLVVRLDAKDPACLPTGWNASFF